MDFIKIENVYKDFDGVQALENVSFSVEPGEIHGLVGENGSGKSTLMKIIAGVLRADTGKITIQGQTVHSYGPLSGMLYGISVIYQDLSLFPNLNVLENISLCTQIAKRKNLYSNRQNITQIKNILEMLDADINLYDLVEELPIAKQQLVAIARALNNEAKLLIFDEPTTALTREEINNLFSIIRKLKQQNTAIIFISHKLDEIMEICDKISVLRDGKLIATSNKNLLSIPEIEKLMVGQSLIYTKNSNRDIKQNIPIVLEVKNLCKKNNFRDINFVLRKKEILGITGLLGSGRTELATALFGIAPPDSGQIIIDNQPVCIKNVQHAVKNGIAYVPEDRLTQGLIMNYSQRENISIAMLKNFKAPNGLIDEKKITLIADKWIKTLKVKTDSMYKTVKTLSGGNQQKIVLGKWLEMHPKVLILDGPTVGVDIGAKAGLFRTINEMVEATGMSVILISDEIREITANCHTVLILQNGRIRHRLEKPEEINESYIHSLLESQKQNSMKGYKA